MNAQGLLSLPLLLLLAPGCTGPGLGSGPANLSLAPAEVALPSESQEVPSAGTTPELRYVAAHKHGLADCQATCAQAGLKCAAAQGSSAVATVFVDPFDNPGQAVDNSSLHELLPTSCAAPLPPPSAAGPAQSLMCICA